jgi:hypothetical protein
MSPVLLLPLENQQPSGGSGTIQISVREDDVDISLKGRKAIVSGSTSGIGYAIAQRLADAMSRLEKEVPAAGSARRACAVR